MADLTFDPEKHEYRYDGCIVPSVTQLLKWAGLIDDTWFSDWHSERGRLIHLACQYYDEGTLEMASVHPEIAGYLESYVKWREAAQNIVIREIEWPQYDPVYDFAGTCDRIIEFNSDTLAVVDIKSGAYQPWHGLQLAGYKILSLGTTNAGFGCDIQRYSLYLDKDGHVARMRAHTDESDWEFFISFLNAYKWKKKNGVTL